MNPDLDRLHPYPFEKLARLTEGVTPPADRPAINLAVGEPKHPTPGFIAAEIMAHLGGLAQYPLTRGAPRLREAAAQWLCRRYGLPPASVTAERHVLPVNGTREALFAFAQCVVERCANALVVMPNPFYQIYEGAALLAGAEPWYVNTTQQSGGVPEFDSVPEKVWARCQLLYVCTPGNPTGAVLALAALQRLIELAERHDFVIASDECYSEIYLDEAAPPPGLLQAAAALGNTEYRRCVVFHSLSKRSNCPGMRSGFVAGDARIIAAFHRYRTYHGCAMPAYHQAASAAAWRDEAHVAANRILYREKFGAVLELLAPVLNVSAPAAGFYLWPETPIDDAEFARGLYGRSHVTVLPGSYLSREAHGVNPGRGRVRIALVAPLAECRAAACAIQDFVRSL